MNWYCFISSVDCRGTHLRLLILTHFTQWRPWKRYKLSHIFKITLKKSNRKTVSYVNLGCLRKKILLQTNFNYLRCRLHGSGQIFGRFNLFIQNRANSVKDFSTVSTSKNWFCAPRVNETRIRASFFPFKNCPDPCKRHLNLLRFGRSCCRPRCLSFL